MFYPFIGFMWELYKTSDYSTKLWLKSQIKLKAENSTRYISYCIKRFELTLLWVKSQIFYKCSNCWEAVHKNMTSSTVVVEEQDVISSVMRSYTKLWDKLLEQTIYEWL